MKPRSFVPIIAVVLLFLPVLYVGSYFALVVPEREGWLRIDGIDMPFRHPYRFGESWSSFVFWPLEQIDRRVRPGVWEWEQVTPE